jgi:hypothetical protein
LTALLFSHTAVDCLAMIAARPGGKPIRPMNSFELTVSPIRLPKKDHEYVICALTDRRYDIAQGATMGELIPTQAFELVFSPRHPEFRKERTSTANLVPICSMPTDLTDRDVAGRGKRLPYSPLQGQPEAPAMRPRVPDRRSVADTAVSDDLDAALDGHGGDLEW